MKNYALLISSFAWPVVVLVIAMMFRNEIIALVKRLEKLVGFGIEAGFYGSNRKVEEENRGSRKTVSADIKSIADKVDKSKTADIFWVAHDLTFLADVLLRGGPQKLIVDQLRLSCQHLDKLGLKETELYTRLSKTYEESKTSRENDWDKEKRLAIANEAFSLLRRLGDVIEATQPDFE